MILKTADLSIDRIHEAPNKNMNFYDMLLSSKMAQEDLMIRERFVKFANKLKKVAPKANDFLYFSAVMLHSGEASLLDDNGEIKKDAKGNPVSAEWKIDEKKGSWKWVCSDENIKPYKNNNGDIFPELELKKAYKKWIGRPLCKDHQSSSVDGVRGIVVDTYYDEKFKRVIGLFALDKVNYPDLARKVESGYLTDVSMGTAVGTSVCYNCGNPAKIESDYCNCVRNRTTYGEINIDLSPIELSLVVTGADPKAKLRHVIASLNNYTEEKKARIDELQRAGCVTPGELEKLASDVEELRSSLKALKGLQSQAAIDADSAATLRNLTETLEMARKDPNPNPDTIANLEAQIRALSEEGLEASDEASVVPPYGMAGNKEMTGGKGGIGQDPESSGPPGYAFEHRNNTIANQNLNLEIKGIYEKLDAMGNALRILAKGVHKKEDQKMSDAKLLERAAARRAMLKKAYHQGGGGVNDPATLPYPVDPTNDQLKTKGDKQMEGQGMEPGKDGMHPGYQSYGNEEALKKKLSRAEQEQRKLERHALLSQAQGDSMYKDDQGNTYVKTQEGVKKVMPVQSADSGFEFPVVASDGTVIRNQAEYLSYVNEQSALGKEPSFQKAAYYQGGGGVNEPQTYPVDPLNDQLKTKGDKQMEGQGMEPGKDGMHPGYQSYGNEEALKKKMLRADKKLRAKFSLAFKDEDKRVIDKENSKWEIFAGSEKVLEATGAEIYEDELEANWDVLASKRYGREVLRSIRNEGLERVAYLLKGEGFTKTAQPPMPGAPAAPEAPMPGAGAPAELPEDAGPDAGGDPVETAVKALSDHLADAEKALGDLQDAVQETTGETEADLPSTAQAEADDEEEQDAQYADDAAATWSERATETYSALNESADELALLAEAIETRVKAGHTSSDAALAELVRLSKAAVEENKQLRTEAALIVEAAKKKDDDEDKDDKKKDKKEDKDEDKKEDKDDKKKDKKEDKDEDDDEKKDGKKSKAELMLENLLRARADRRRELARTAMLPADDDLDDLKGLMKEHLGEEAEEKDDEGELEHPDLAEGLEGLEVEEDASYADEGGYMSDLDAQLAQMLDEVDMAADDEDEMCADDEDEEMDADDGIELTAAQRRAWREKVAAEAAGYQGKKMDLSPAVTSETDMPLGQTSQLGQLSTKSDEAKVEGLEDQHNKIMDAVKNLPKVREAMAHMVKLMKVGALGETDFSNAAKLEALAVDPAAVSYWKQYFSQADKESSAFATELTKEYSKKKTAASADEQRARVRRAYEVAVEMQDKGLIPDGVEALHAQSHELEQLTDAGFESFKKVVAGTNKAHVKTASAAPAVQMGVVESSLTNGTAVSNSSPANLVDQLKRMW